MSVEIRKIEQNLCRCCHSEGIFDNLAKPKQVLDHEEIYCNMLKECFNVEIIAVPGELCSSIYSICKACILRLQDANSFKKQVLDCERRFMDLYLNDAIKVLNSEKASFIKEEDDESEADFKEVYISPDDDNDEEYDIKQDEDNPESDTELKLTLKNRKNVKQKIVKSKSKRKNEVKKTKNLETKGKKGADISQHYTLKEDANGAIYSCNICNNAFRKRDCFKQHYRHVHLKRRPKVIGCYYCEEKVPPHMRAYHLEKAHGVPAPSCGACGKKFSYPFQVLKHQKTFHMGERKFVCSVCDMSFASRGNLVQHEVKHSSLRPFKCDLCEETFKLKKHLSRHRLIHSNQKKNIISEEYFTITTADDGTKDFTCTICKHVFKKRQNFTQHYKHVHLKQRPKLRSCHLCDVKVPAYMRAFHMEEHGLPAPSCGACGKKFSYPFQVLQHQKYYHMGERKFACEFCDLRFRSRYGLTKHTIKHTGERSFKCDLCEKSFKWKNNLRIHLMMHLNDKRHVCPVCEEAFVQTSSLKYHIVKRHPDLV